MNKYPESFVGYTFLDARNERCKIIGHNIYDSSDYDYQTSKTYFPISANKLRKMFDQGKLQSPIVPIK